MIDGKNNLSVPTIIFSQFLSFEWYEKRTNIHHSFASQSPKIAWVWLHMILCTQVPTWKRIK